MNGIEAYIKAMLYKDAMALDKQLRNNTTKEKKQEFKKQSK